MALVVIPLPVTYAGGQLASTNVVESEAAWSATAFYTAGAKVHYQGRLYLALIGGAAQTATFNSASDTVSIGGGVGSFADGDLVGFGSSGGTLAAGLTQGATYYVVTATGSNFKIEASPGSGAIDITTTGTGTQSAYENPNYGRNPATESGFWQDAGPSNQYAMFDNSSTTRTSATGSITVTVNPGGRFDVIGLKNLSNVRTVRIQAGSYYDQTFSLEDPTLSSWYSGTYHSDTAYRTSFGVADIPPLSGASVTITMTGVGTVSCGGMIAGLSKDIGPAERSSSVSYESYNRPTPDQYGTFTSNPSNYSDLGSWDLFVDGDAASAVQALIISRRVDPSLWLMAPDANVAGGWDSSGIIFGIPTNARRRFTHHGHNPIALELTGYGTSDTLEFVDLPLWDFTLSETLPSEITFSRASTGTRLSEFNILETKAIDVARYQYQGGSRLGLLIEPQRTKLNPRSKAATGTWTAIGGTGANVTDNALTYFAGMTVASNGSTSDAYRTPNTISLASGTTYVERVMYRAGTSGKCRVVLHSGAVSSELAGNAGALAAISSGFGTITILRQYQINLVEVVEFSITVNATSATCYIGVGPYTTTAGQNVTVYSAEIEEGDACTSYVDTTGSTVVRSADVATISGTNFSEWWNAAEGTLVTTVTSPGIGTKFLWQVDDGTANNRMYVYTTGTSLLAVVITGGVLQANIGIGTITANTPFRVGFAFDSTGAYACLNGGAVQSDTSVTLPTVNNLKLGANTTQSYNVIISRLATYPTRRTDAQLQALTA